MVITELALIFEPIGFEEGPAYAIENPNGGVLNIVLTRYVVCVQGKVERKFPYIFCSNSKLNEVRSMPGSRYTMGVSSYSLLTLTQVDFAEYKQAADEASVPVPTKAFLLKKADAIHALRTRRWTEEELQEKLKKSGVIAERQAHIQRVTLRAERRDAERRHDKAAVARVNQQLRELNKGPQLAYKTTKYRSDPDPQPSEPAEPPPPTAAQKDEARKAEMRSWREKQYQELLAAQEEEENKKKTLKKRKFVPKSSPKPAGEGGGSSGNATGSSGAGGASPASRDPKIVQRGENIDMVKLLALERAQYKTDSGMPGVGNAASYDDLMEAIDLGIEIEL